MKQAALDAPKQSTDIAKTIRELEIRLNSVNRLLNGDGSLARREFETAPSVRGRVFYIIGSLWNTTAAPTQTQISSYETAAGEFTPVYNELKAIAAEVKKLEDLLEKNGAPYTPGRLPEWKGGN
jgi:hypothetical protein